MENNLTEDQKWVREHPLFYKYFADAKSAMGITDQEYDSNPEYALMVDDNIWLIITSLEDEQND